MAIIVILLVVLFITVISQYLYMASITDKKMKSFISREPLDSHPDVILIK